MAIGIKRMKRRRQTRRIVNRKILRFITVPIRVPYKYCIGKIKKAIFMYRITSPIGFFFIRISRYPFRFSKFMYNYSINLARNSHKKDKEVTMEKKKTF